MLLPLLLPRNLAGYSGLAERTIIPLHHLKADSVVPVLEVLDMEVLDMVVLVMTDTIIMAVLVDSVVHVLEVDLEVSEDLVAQAVSEAQAVIMVVLAVDIMADQADQADQAVLEDQVDLVDPAVVVEDLVVQVVVKNIYNR